MRKPVLAVAVAAAIAMGDHSAWATKLQWEKPTWLSSPAKTLSSLPDVEQQLVAPPHVPAHAQTVSGMPKIVRVQLVAREFETDPGDGRRLPAMTYNGSIPGPAIVVHQGDYVDVTVVNPKTNRYTHSIDLHAATGKAGGAEETLVAPGERKTWRFRADKAGVFIYHCAPGGVMTPYHVASGMSGAIVVLPRDGLKDAHGNPVRYDRVYYIGEQDFYAPDAAGDEKLALKQSLEKMRALKPTHIVYNGAIGSLTGENALTARVGERVLFIHMSANRDTRAHVIGEHADLFWPLGSFSATPIPDAETWPIPAGSAVAALVTFDEPGVYTYINHNLIEGVMYGAAAQIKVSR